MKRFIRDLCCCTVLFITLFSCGTFPFEVYEKRSWPSGKAFAVMGRVKIIGIAVERAGGSLAIEKELTAVAPLVLREAGYLAVETAEDWLVGISLREREYSAGWKTKKSLSAEIRFWPADSDTFGGDALPYAAGRVLSGGEKSFASSKVMTDMLGAAVKEAAGVMRRKQGNKK